MATPASYESKAPKTRRFPFGLPRRRWIGLATVVLIVASVFFYYCATPTVPRFPNATLCFITADGRELAQAGLQASPDPIIYSINSAKCVLGNSTVHVDWRYLGSGTAGDSYEFKTTVSGGVPTTRRVWFDGDRVELLRAGDIVVAIQQQYGFD